ncbi:GAF domain-containing sensor histidine kinase [Bradyrhizobium sp. Arg68]|nr:GAF domain-containing sensor histidine kinase [Bradyrhizobium ivorense]
MTHDFQPDIDAIETIAAVPVILTAISHVTGMGFVAVARVTEERWVCLAADDQTGLGLAPGGELKIETTLCREVRQTHEAVVIDHVAEDALYCGHPVPALYGFQSYISMPIFLKDGSFYGTLCALDFKPSKIKNPGIIGMFRSFADLIGIHIDAAKRLVTAEANLLDAEAATELREQFIAVLGHDLRNPLASILTGVALLRTSPLDAKGQTVVGRMEKSARRMSALIDDVMDLARARLGDGITLTPSDEALEPALRQVIDELRAAHPNRIVEAEFNLSTPVRSDRERIARLLSNLLGNALAYSPADTPVRVSARTTDAFELTVTNCGPTIPPAMRERLFLPFVRGADRSGPKGLGLGLYIVSQIATAHSGSIDVVSKDDETRFTFRMPLQSC